MTSPLVILPMAGFGSRFQKAGYPNYKPFIPILGKPMIDWALKPYPTSLQKALIINRDALTNDEHTYLKNIPNTTLIEITPHKLGPAFSIHVAKDFLPKNGPCFVSYLDIFWTWDYAEIKRHLDSDGIVFTRQQFHPHLIQNNFSAFCKTNGENLIEIKEKGSFTDNWMDEPLSIGTFYFKSIQTLQNAIKSMIETQEKVADEYFPSQAFNHLLKQGQTVTTYPVDFFVHWGTPEQLEDALYWAEPLEKPFPKTPITNLCCMGGTGSRMKQIDPTLPKACLPLFNVPMWHYIAQTFSSQKPHCIVTDDMKNRLQLSHPDTQMFSIGVQTQSQIETLTKALPFLKNNNRFFLTSCDAYGHFDHDDFQTFLNSENPDAVIFTFNPTLTQKKMGKHHSHVSMNKNLDITDVHIKSKSSETDKGLAGFFWFKDGKSFEILPELHSNGEELCVDHLLKALCKKKVSIKGYPLKKYFHLGTPDEYQEFLFWQTYQNALH